MKAKELIKHDGLSLKSNHHTEFFFSLLRVGLWENCFLPATPDGSHLPAGEVNWEIVLKLAKQQSVVGLVTAGIEVSRANVPQFPISQFCTMKFIKQVIQLEKRNAAMNQFIGLMTKKMHNAGIETVLVKGQGVAQCYERPQWRTCGDVDFFLDEDNYERAKEFLRPYASIVENEYVREKHLGMGISKWIVELHGTLRGGLSVRINRVLDEIQRETFRGGHVRFWDNNGVTIKLLSVENDIVFVFAHFINHFFKEGLGLRQICDWCRLLWVHKDHMDKALIEKRIRQMGLGTEWNAFVIYAMLYLGLPLSTNDLLLGSCGNHKSLKRKAERINNYILKVGNMGLNRDMSHFSKYPYLVRKLFSMKRRLGDLLTHARIFPLDALKFLPTIMYYGVRSTMRGE
ncbi:MAG: nucleotidyltransferase family protein [Prevotella sp.]|nr:nucleotidyltransferase family protein [Prevotella sp.]